MVAKSMLSLHSNCNGKNIMITFADNTELSLLEYIKDIIITYSFFLEGLVVPSYVIRFGRNLLVLGHSLLLSSLLVGHVLCVVLDELRLKRRYV